MAFNFVAMMLITLHATYFCETLGIPLDSPITSATLNDKAFITINCEEGSITGIGASFIVPKYNYVFSFSDGYLSSFLIKNYLPGFDKGKEEFEKRRKELCLIESKIDKQRAYQLATNWLVLGGVDITKLESGYTNSISQHEYSFFPKGGEFGPITVLKSPIFTVKWEGKSRHEDSNTPRDVCTVVIDGSTEKLILWRVSERSLFRTSPLAIRDKQSTPEDYEELLATDELLKEIVKSQTRLNDSKNIQTYTPSEIKEMNDAEEILEMSYAAQKKILKDLSYIKNLLSIPDEEFLKMDATQKSNLIKRFVPPESFPPQKKPEKAEYFKEKTEEKTRSKKNN